MMSSDGVCQVLMCHLREYNHAVRREDTENARFHNGIVDTLALVLDMSLIEWTHRLTSHGYMVSAQRTQPGIHVVELRWFRPTGRLFCSTPGLYAPPDERRACGRLLCRGDSVRWLFGMDEWIPNPLLDTWYDVETGGGTAVGLWTEGVSP